MMRALLDVVSSKTKIPTGEITNSLKIDISNVIPHLKRIWLLSKLELWVPEQDKLDHVSATTSFSYATTRRHSCTELIQVMNNVAFMIIFDA